MASITDGNSRDSQTKIRRSMFRKRTRFRDLRLNTSNCWRRTRISASRAARASNAERRASRIRLSNANPALGYEGRAEKLLKEAVSATPENGFR
jgi:hypothetical protein